MPFVPADLRIEVRKMAPMTVRDEVLEDHSLLVRDGRILDILPSPIAAQRYPGTPVLQRPAHLLVPGMINAHADSAVLLGAADSACGPDMARDCVLAAVAQMLKSGVTCFADRGYFPHATAQAAKEQGMRAQVGMPVSDAPTPWARNAAQSLTHSLNLRDEYRDEALVSTVFAPRAINTLGDATFSRLITLADELDAGIMLDLHQSLAEIAECEAAHGLRPIERLWKLGLMTPALNAIHMVQVTAADIALAQRTGISISICPQSDLKLKFGQAPAAAMAAAGIRVGLGNAGGAALSRELWGEMKITALLSQSGAAQAPALSAWDVLHMATAGGAAVLGLESGVGTLEAGKWADLCCVDLSGPDCQSPLDPLSQVVFNGSRDMVSDVWVAGRQLVSGGGYMRLDWAEVSRRSQSWLSRINREAGE
jgi:5-methylthioadenosine/S-adenosylhomocysteine deaminase